MEVRTLWLQRHVTEGRIELARRPGKENESDIGTKYLARPELDAILTRLGYQDRSGRSALTLRASLGAATEGLSVQRSGEAPPGTERGGKTKGSAKSGRQRAVARSHPEEG